MEMKNVNSKQSKETKKVTFEELRKSGHPALERIAKNAAANMRSSAYTSHNSHHSSHN